MVFVFFEISSFGRFCFIITNPHYSQIFRIQKLLTNESNLNLLVAQKFILTACLIHATLRLISYHALQPPSTFRVSPVMYLAASEARKDRLMQHQVQSPFPLRSPFNRKFIEVGLL